MNTHSFSNSVAPLSMAPIDAVITWVDGADPVHAAKLSNYLTSIGGVRPQAASPTRFHNAGELDYCVASILRFAPWIGTIFIVTDEQTPALVAQLKGSQHENRVKIIDHKTIFSGYEKYLPTFNSMAITSLLWKIPGLAEQFIYFNDDFVLLGPVEPEDFFVNGKVVLRGKWKSQPDATFLNRLIQGIKRTFRSRKKNARISYWGLQQQCGKLLGFNHYYFRLPHTPHPWKKSTWEALNIHHGQVLMDNIAGRFRSGGQHVPESLSAHAELKDNNALLASSFNVQLKPGEQSYWRIKLKLIMANKNKKILFSCVQSIETASLAKRKLIFSWLEERVGSIDDL